MIRKLGTYTVLLAFVVLVNACADEDDRSVHGKVSVEFVAMSDSEITFRLINGLDHAVQIRGIRTLSRAIRVWRSEAQISCETSTGGRQSVMFGFTDGIEPKYVEVKPNKRAELVIPTRFRQQRQGGRCSLELMLKDGTVAASIEFEP